MKLIKKAAEYSVFQRKDGRYAVRGNNKNWIHGEDKVSILQDEGLLKKPEPKAEPEPEPETDAAEETSDSEAE